MKIQLKHKSLFLILFLFVVAGQFSLSAQNQGSAIKLKTVVLDPGHGGKDPGAVSKDRKTFEKNLTLDIAKRLGQKIKAAYPEVNVIYTRQTDKYVELIERANIANRNNADLFISIHINAASSTSANGFSSHILGQSSKSNNDLFSNHFDVCRRENSVILLEEDYSAKYEGFNPDSPESFIFFNLMQNAYYEQSILFAAEVDEELNKEPFRTNRGLWQNPFLVLWKTKMPSVLLELGFISNSSDLAVLRSETGREKIANCLLRAFKNFKNTYDGSLEYTVAPTADTKSPVSDSARAESHSELAAETAAQYGIQVFLLSRRLSDGAPELKGYKPSIYKVGTMYKHLILVSDSAEEVRKNLPTIKKKFPGSFMVKIEGEKISKF